MNVNYSEKIKANSSWFSHIQAATRVLEESAGPTAATVKWDVVDLQEAGRTREVIGLKIVDAADEVAVIIDPETLASPHQFRLIVLQLWGRMLANRYQRMTENILQSGREPQVQGVDR